MALLTRKNLRTEQAKAGAVVAGLFGLLAVMVTNIDKIMDTYRYFAEVHEASDARGSWLGIFRELDSQNKGYILSNESMFLTASRDHIFGTIDATLPIVRHHDIQGSIKDGFLIAEYHSTNTDRPGAVVYLLKYGMSPGTWVGFWTGYDPDERAIMSCPYILTRHTNPAQVQSQFKEWLGKDCVR